MTTENVYVISNDELKISVNSFGAELSSIRDKNDVEYLWCGDKEYWGRQAPVLFPFVGLCKNKQYTYNGKIYNITSHGFARDMEFKLVSKTDTGLVVPNASYSVETDKDGYLKITDNMFENDALVIENNQIHKVSLCYNKEPYVTVEFKDMPLCGIWSPIRGDAPFICIEPWLGRCDAEDFEGDIFARKYINVIDKGETFEKSYRMTFHPVL